MKKNITLIGVMIFSLFFVSNVYAESITNTVKGTLGGWSSYSTTSNILGDYYKYVRLEFTPSKATSFYVSLIGANSVSGLGGVDALNPSKTLSAAKGEKKVIYILPRSGMNCPSDADYCFGTGNILSKTTVVQGNECNGKMCNVYGIRIKNEKLFSSYDFTLKYEFVK